MSPADEPIGNTSNRGNNQGSAVSDAIVRAEATGKEIQGQFGAQLRASDRLKIIKAFTRAAFPSTKQRGRKRNPKIEAAFQDWLQETPAGVLFQKHIPNHSKLSEWRRQQAEQRLMNAIYQRKKRT